MCIGYCNICGCKMKAIPSFCYTLQYLLRCNLISTWTDLQNLPESDRAVVILVCSNFSNKIIFPKNDYIKYLQQICMCVCAPYKPHRQSACEHEHNFNQAVKLQNIKVIKAGAVVSCFVPLVKELGWWVCCSCPKILFPKSCAPDCISPATAKNKLQGDNVDLLVLGTWIPAGEVFFS